ncbi:MAG: hypothetical protein HXY22_11540 [Alphaproteobacteria bacterium]|nr:hypothetical protein [Alphaproteobacteria bacterium]
MVLMPLLRRLYTLRVLALLAFAMGVAWPVHGQALGPTKEGLIPICTLLGIKYFRIDETGAMIPVEGKEDGAPLGPMPGLCAHAIAADRRRS